MKHLLISFLFVPFFTYAQDGKNIGISVSNGISGNGFEAVYNEIGIEVENRYTIHSSITLGVSMVHYSHEEYNATMDYVRMPFSYKLHTKLFNIAPIFMVDFINKRHFDPSNNWNSYTNYYPNISYGFGLALSKGIVLNKDFLLEYKAQANLDAEEDPSYTIGLTIRYKVN